MGAVALALVGTGLSGCQEDAAPGGSTPAATVTPSPTPTEDPLFTEAKKVHLTYVQQLLVIEKDGGGAKLPYRMQQVVGGEFEETLSHLYSDFQKKGVRASTESSVGSVKAWEVPPSSGHDAALGACVDFHDVTYDAPGLTRPSKGMWRSDALQFDRRGATLVIVDGSSKQVRSCEPSGR